MLKNLLGKSLENKMLRLQAEAIVTGKKRKMVMPYNFMNEKKCTFLKEMTVVPHVVNRNTGEVHPNLNPDWNVIFFHPDGTITLSIIKKHESVMTEFNGIKMLKYNSFVYSVSL